MNVNMNESFFNFFRSLFENKLEKSDVLIEEKDVPEFLRIASSHQLVALTCKELSRQLPHNRYIKLYTNRFNGGFRLCNIAVSIICLHNHFFGLGTAFCHTAMRGCPADSRAGVLAHSCTPAR